MEDQLMSVIRQKLGVALEFEFPDLTKREARLPSVPGKAHAVIGMRRSGKTWYLYQCLQEQMASGTPRDRLIYFNFEDERLGEMRGEDLGFIIEEYYRTFPAYRGREQVTFCFDEIQTYCKTKNGYEIDFRVRSDTGQERLIQVAADVSSAATLARELRALDEAASDHQGAALLLVSEVPEERVVRTMNGKDVRLLPVWRFLLRN